mgnify:CR=1 FL=1
MSAAQERASNNHGPAREDGQEPGVSTSRLRPVWIMIKHLVRRPWIRRRLGEFLPNVYFGYTDHPLDSMGPACNSIFSFFPKTMQRTASCVLGVSLRERTQTSFTFDARGYNVFRIRDLERSYAHEYTVRDDTPYELLTLRIDVLTPHVYRLRLGRGTTVAEHRTPMVADEPDEPGLRVGLEETDESYRISTGALVLTVSREQFQITIAGADGREITRSGGKTGTEFVTAMESFSLHPGEAVYEIPKEVKGRAVIWARSAYAGSQRYPVHCSGDNSSNFANMLCSLRGGLSLGMCGFSFWSQDTGGFVGTPTEELYIRWTQLAIFQSHIRYHGSPPRFREPWNFEPRTQEIVRRYLELRYRLIPYLYSEAHAAARDGLPLMHP